MATMRQQEGATPGLGGPVTASKVAWLREVWALPAGGPAAPGACPDGPRGDGRYSAQAAGQRLNVEVRTRVDGWRPGRLDDRQQTSHRPRWGLLPSAILAALRKPRRHRKPRRLPHAGPKRLLRASGPPSAPPPQADHGHSQSPWGRGAVGRTRRQAQRPLFPVGLRKIAAPNRRGYPGVILTEVVDPPAARGADQLVESA